VSQTFFIKLIFDYFIY